MSKEKRRVPKLRFPGFTEDWEQRKLSDITDVIMGQSPSSKNYTDNPNDNILVQGNADLKDGKVIPRLWTKEITKTIDKNGIILTVRAPVGDVAKTDYKVVLGRGVAGIKGNDFIYHFLQKLQYNRHWISLSSGSTFESINSNDIKDLIIDIPSIEEQNKISILLNNINSIITLHQRKLDNLKLKKKALLQKLFPKNGERYPELRFPGFTDAWEQRKFSDLYEKISEKNDLSYSLDKIISVANMYYKSDVKVSNEEYLKTYNIFRYGEIAFEGNKSKDFAYGRFVENTIGDGIISHVFEVFRPITKYDIYFWKYYINYEPIMGKVLSRCTKKTTMMTNLVAKDFLKESVLVPTLAEQKQIGIFLNNLDQFITLHQRKLDHLQLQKKALLQQMFV